MAQTAPARCVRSGNKSTLCPRGRNAAAAFEPSDWQWQLTLSGRDGEDDVWAQSTEKPDWSER